MTVTETERVEQELDERVQDGAAFLGEHVVGWRNQIDKDRLDMGDHCGCILGQMYGTFFAGMMTLGLEMDDAKRYGFETATECFEYPALKEAWLRELA